MALCDFWAVAGRVLGIAFALALLFYKRLLCTLIRFAMSQVPFMAAPGRRGHLLFVWWQVVGCARGDRGAIRCHTSCYASAALLAISHPFSDLFIALAVPSRAAVLLFVP